MSGRRVRIVLQARTTSSRLPAKVLLPMGPSPLALLCAARLGNRGREVVLATSRDPSDDLLVQMAEAAGLSVHRGPLEDVLTRFVDCTNDLDPDDVVVRATADNPVPDGSLVDDLIRLMESSGEGYVATGSLYQGLPYGVSAEAFTVRALRVAAAEAVEAFDREHVTPLMKRNAVATMCDAAPFAENAAYVDLRVTVDTLADYLRMAEVIRRVPDPERVGWRELVRRVLEHDCQTVTIPTRLIGGTSYGVLTLGTAQLGLPRYGAANRAGAPAAEEARAMLEAALASGVTHADTARVYGQAELRIGDLEPTEGTRRLRIMTKISALPDEIVHDAEAIERFVDDSLARSLQALRRINLDVVMLHRAEDVTRAGGAALRRLVYHQRRRAIGEIGVSVYHPAEALAALAKASITHLQVPFNLLDTRWQEPETLSVLAERGGVKVHARSVFLQGLLLSDEAIWPAWFSGAQEVLNKIDRLVGELGRQSRADLCMAYVRSFPWVTSLVVGVETLPQLEQLLSLVARPPLSDDEVHEVNREIGRLPSRLLDPSQW